MAFIGNNNNEKRLFIKGHFLGAAESLRKQYPCLILVLVLFGWEKNELLMQEKSLTHFPFPPFPPFPSPFLGADFFTVLRPPHLVTQSMVNFMQTFDMDPILGRPSWKEIIKYNAQEVVCWRNS